MSEENKPKPTLDDVNAPIMRLDASRMPEAGTVALNEGIRNREAIANTKLPEPKQPGAVHVERERAASWNAKALMYSDAKIRTMLLIAAVTLAGMAVWQLVERLMN